MEVADKIDPGYSRFRGILLYELQTAMVLQAKKEFCKDLITKTEAEVMLKNLYLKHKYMFIFQEKLRRSLDILHESCRILLVEPEFKETIQEKLGSLNSMLDI